ncbi:LOW QUALITY PROTEIN: hypothetical protein OSB04_027619 [Centaurea solstitialis]|uniref:Dynamin-related protein 4C-like n=1 Tax=Centaurea solstitialis TaxID=347529 RepID=A0AA38SLL3_9ASTR|nr:LOW QUALITY PROTEIN: hypothetical protein OSB04_027619 [Centaurea solstitialis]
MAKNVVVHNDNGGEVIHPFTDPPRLASSYSDKIRPILDAVDNLCRLKVTEEGIPLLTIVVVGDQSSGKSSVLESLAEISLPSGQGICTRVLLVMRLQHHLDPEPKFKKVEIGDEGQICDAIDQATVEIAGDRKGISNVPLTLIMKKKGVPDLTMVDLPGITRVPVHDQPDDIYEQIADMVMEAIDFQIKAEESIILNVLSTAVDFPTCESIRIPHRTAVVTKCVQSPDDLEKVTANDDNIGLGYICVRNQINDETYEEAREREAMLFDTHHLLSKIDNSMVGVPVLATRLVEIQSVIISKCLPGIVKKINERLDASLNKLPRKLANVPDATVAFMQMVGSLKETLQNILIRGEFDEYEDDKQMHCNARLVEMLDEFSKELDSSVKFSENFLADEIGVIEEGNGIRLPYFLPHSTFLFMLKKRVEGIAELPVNFINNVWGYLETVCIKVFVDRCRNYPQLLPSMKKADHNAMAKTKAKFVERVFEMIEMEKVTDYTCDPNFNGSLKKLMSSYDAFVNAIKGFLSSSGVYVEGYGVIDVKHLVNVAEKAREQTFDLKMRMTAYWEIVLRKMVDWIALQLRFVIRQMVNTEMQTEIVNAVIVNDGGIDKMMTEPASMAKKREKLRKSIGLLQESKEVMGQVIDGISIVTD